MWEVLDQSPGSRLVADSSIGRWYKRSQVKNGSVRISGLLTQHGVSEGDVVCCSCENSVAFACAILGIGFAGAAFSLCDAYQPSEDWISEVSQCQPRFLLTDAGPRLLTSIEVAKHVTSVSAIFCLVVGGEKETLHPKIWPDASLPIRYVDFDLCELDPAVRECVNERIRSLSFT